MNIRRTPTTIARLSIRLMMKSFVDFMTWSDCIYISLSSMPTGRNASSSFSLADTLRPMFTTLPPSTVEMPIASAGLLLNFIMKLCGSAYALLTVAISLRRVKVPPELPMTRSPMSSTDKIAPVGEMRIYLSPSVTLPAEVIVFCWVSAASTIRGESPRDDILDAENSMYTASVCSPKILTLATSSTSTKFFFKKSA